MNAVQKPIESSSFAIQYCQRITYWYHPRWKTSLRFVYELYKVTDI